MRPHNYGKSKNIKSIYH